MKYLSDCFSLRLGLLRLGLNRVTGTIRFLPALFVSVTGGCNSRCGPCGIWNGPDDELSATVIEKTMAGLKYLGLRNVVITGGEPLLRSDLADILNKLVAQGFRLVLCTNGILLKQHREMVLKYFDSVAISLDTHDPSLYMSIRGVDAFDEVVAGITSIVGRGKRVTLAHTLQKDNILHLVKFIDYAKKLGVDSVSVRPLDAYSPGFGSEGGNLPIRSTLLPPENDLAAFSEIIKQVQMEFSEDLASGFITPNGAGLWKIRKYLLAKTEDSFPKTRCSAPFSSCVIESNGDIKPCFFSESFANIHDTTVSEGKDYLNSGRARRIRDGLRGNSPLCRRCAYPYIWL